MAITRAQQARQMLKKGTEPVEQAGVMNYMPSEMITVPKVAKSSPDTPTAKLAYITPKEEDILVNLNLYGSLDGKPNRGPGGLPSLEGDFGSPSGQAGTGPGSGGTYGGAEGPDVSGRKDRGTGDYRVTDRKAQEDYDKNRAIREYNQKQVEKLEAINKAKELDKEKKLNFAERVRVLGLKNLYDQKMGLKFAGPSILGNLASMASPELDVYESTSEDDLMDTGYGMTGKDLTATDRLADAINKAETTGDITQSEFEDAFFGDKGPPDLSGDKGGEGGQPIIPIIPQAASTPVEEEDYYASVGGNPFENRQAYRLFNKGGIADTVVGGEFDFESARQMYGLGKLVKKVTRTVKKIAKSPIGKAALIGVAGFGIPGTSFGGLLGRASFGGAAKGLFGTYGPASALRSLGLMKTQVRPNVFERVGPLSKFGPMSGIFAASALAGLMTRKEEEEDDEEFYRGEGIDIADIRSRPSFYQGQAYRFMAEGGDTEDAKEPVAKKTMPLLDMGGKEMDLRAEGGFVPIGRMEKADDVPARLSKNEFVFTADAVRNAGDGDVDKGAEVMYNMMKNLESGGDVSEESQGLKGAREMFQTSQRLGEVI